MDLALVLQHAGNAARKDLGGGLFLGRGCVLAHRGLLFSSRGFFPVGRGVLPVNCSVFPVGRDAFPVSRRCVLHGGRCVLVRRDSRIRRGGRVLPGRGGSLLHRGGRLVRPGAGLLRKTAAQQHRDAEQQCQEPPQDVVFHGRPPRMEQDRTPRCPERVSSSGNVGCFLTMDTQKQAQLRRPLPAYSTEGEVSTVSSASAAARQLQIKQKIPVME